MLLSGPRSQSFRCWNTTRCCFLFDLDVLDVVRPGGVDRHDELVVDEPEDGDQKSADDDGRDDGDQAHAARAHGDDLIVPGQIAERQERRDQRGDRQGRCGHGRNTVEKIEHHLADVRLVVDEAVGLLQEIHAEVDDQDAGQDGQEDPDEFPEYVSAQYFHGRPVSEDLSSRERHPVVGVR